MALIRDQGLRSHVPLVLCYVGVYRQRFSSGTLLRPTHEKFLEHDWRFVTDEDLDLGERDNSEPIDFPPPERTIHTQGYDLSLNTLKEQWDDKTLVIPEFQREYVWDNSKASRLIESLLLNIPIPQLFLSETADATYEIVDGHQRVFSIIRFLENQFALSGLRIQQEFDGLRYFELPLREQRFLRTRVIRAIIISSDSNPSMKFEVFERLNTGGLALNAQEVRNAIYSGRFNDLIQRLEVDDGFRTTLGSKVPRKRMVDRELVLRFLALHDDFPAYRPPLVRFLNNFMRTNREPAEQWLDAHGQLFRRTVAATAGLLGGAAFRVIDVEGQVLERNVNRAVFDAEMLVFSAVDSIALIEKREAVIENLGLLFGGPHFQDAIRRATGDRSRTRDRVRDLAGAVEAAGIAVDLARFDLND